MSPIDMVLSRLDGFRLRPSGRDRWRACCPAHGGRNASTLSVGIGDGGGVLLRCWSGCEVEAIAQALGLELQDLFPPRESSAGPLPRRRMLPAGQALELIEGEMLLAVVASGDLARGEALDAATRERLLLGAARVSMLLGEVRA